MEDQAELMDRAQLFPPSIRHGLLGSRILWSSCLQWQEHSSALHHDFRFSILLPLLLISKMLFEIYTNVGKSTFYFCFENEKREKEREGSDKRLHG